MMGRILKTNGDESSIGSIDLQAAPLAPTGSSTFLWAFPNPCSFRVPSVAHDAVPFTAAAKSVLSIGSPVHSRPRLTKKDPVAHPHIRNDADLAKMLYSNPRIRNPQR
jgi:hypothetical protein